VVKTTRNDPEPSIRLQKRIGYYEWIPGQQGPLSGSFLWPAHAWRGRLHGQHLTCPPPVGHACGTAPLGRHQEQRSPISASEHAGEAASIEIDRLQDLPALANAHATLIGDVGVPDSVLCIEAYTIGNGRRRGRPTLAGSKGHRRPRCRKP